MEISLDYMSKYLIDIINDNYSKSILISTIPYNHFLNLIKRTDINVLDEQMIVDLILCYIN